MAYRTVFIFDNNRFFKELVFCDWYGNLTREQKQDTIASLHENFNYRFEGLKVLEASTASPVPLGIKLSAFNLKNNQGHTVECVYQGSKIFEEAGPFRDLYTANPLDAKQDYRLKNSGALKSFRLYGRGVKMTPRNLCYNWIYCTALHANLDLVEEVLKYDAFSDLFFNHNTGSACQAESLAIYVALYKTGFLEQAMQSITAFERTIYNSVGGVPCQ